MKLAGAGLAGAAAGSLQMWGPKIAAFVEGAVSGFPQGGGVEFYEGTEAQLEKMRDWFKIESDGTVTVTDKQTGRETRYLVDQAKYFRGVKVFWAEDRRAIVVTMYLHYDIPRKPGDAIVTYRSFFIDEAAKKVTRVTE